MSGVRSIALPSLALVARGRKSAFSKPVESVPISPRPARPVRTDATKTPTDMANPSPTLTAPAVRLELRQGAARPVTYDVTGDEFVVGTVPGCDLRLAGTNLPPKLF